MKQSETRHSPTPIQETARQRKSAAAASASPAMAAQAKFIEGINNSPYVTAQRKKFAALFGGAAQLEAEPAQRVGEEEPLQGKLELAQRAVDEEPLQGKFEPVQRVGEEELLQGKFAPVQRAGEEELLQGKFEPVQRVGEEELLQGKFATVQRVGDEEPLQGKFEPLQRLEEEPLQGRFAPQPAQLKEEAAPKPNNTGLPDNLKHGIESLSGLSMDNVKVHYNSTQPAQLNALAYAQGADIHVAPGQEQHLPHEAWHIVQQAQGRVQPTTQMKGGVPVNDNAGLEREADVMGEKAARRAGSMGNAQNIVQPHGDGERMPKQFLRADARRFIRQNNLGINDRHEDVIEYLADTNNPQEMRTGLREAWNLGQHGRFFIPEGNPRGELSEEQVIRTLWFLKQLGDVGSYSDDESSADEEEKKIGKKSGGQIFTRIGHTGTAHGSSAEKSRKRSEKTDSGYNGRWKVDQFRDIKIAAFFDYLEEKKLGKGVYFVRCKIPIEMGCADTATGDELECDGFFIKMTSMGSSKKKWKFSTCHPRMESTLGGDIIKVDLP